jgi:glycosyltransferase involved in cell wall biosynthesis
VTLAPDLPSPRADDLVFVIPGLWTTGGFRTLYQWMNRLVAVGCRVRVVAQFDGAGRDLLDPRVETLTPSRLRFVLRSPVRVLAQRALGDRTPFAPTPRAVLDLLPRDGTVLTCWAPWLPEVEQVRPTILYAQHWEPVWFESGSRLAQRTERAMLRPGPAIVNSSWLRNHLPAERTDVHLVFPGVDHAIFHAGQAGDASRVRGPELRVVALGRPDPLKGLAELRLAVRELAAGGRAVTLTLFGTAEAYTDRSDGVTEVGVGNLSSAELAELYRTSDVLATPSWYESFPLPPLEAMACGLPVVTTSPGTEDYAVDGENALVVAPRDVPSLVDALDRLAGDPALAERLTAAGLEQSHRFTWDAGYRMFVDAVDAATDQLA